VRAAPLSRPDAVLRKHPLQKVMAAVPLLTTHVVFHPQPIFHQAKRPRCFCGIKSEKDMALCDTCLQWFHFACLGLSGKELQAIDDWKCGYCRGKPDQDGMCEWKMPIPQGDRKRKKVAPKRHVDDTPCARGVADDQDDMRDVGPRTWDDTVADARKGGKAINVKMVALKRRAEKLVKEGGHHIVDEMGAVGLQAREVNQVLVNDLLQENLLEDDEEPEAAAEADEESR
jgi:hypothetical protein